LTIINPNPWWQAKDSGILSVGNITSTIPSNCIGSCIPSLILDGDGGYPGIPVYAGTLSTGSGDTSSTAWEANTTVVFDKTYNYDYFSRQIPGTTVINEIATPTIAGSQLTTGGTASPDGYYWYHFNGAAYGDLTISSNMTIGGSRKIILFVEGANLNLTGDISISTNGSGFFAAFVGKNTSGGGGDITIDPGVGSPSANPDLEGLFLADGGNAFNDYTLDNPNVADSDGQITTEGETQIWGFDMTANDSLVMPVSEEFQTFDDPALHRRQKQGFYGWEKVGFACLDSRMLSLGVIDRTL